MRNVRVSARASYRRGETKTGTLFHLYVSGLAAEYLGNDWRVRAGV